MENFEFFFFFFWSRYCIPYVNDQSKYYSKFLILIIFLIRSISSRISFDLVVFDTSDVWHVIKTFLIQYEIFEIFQDYIVNGIWEVTMIWPDLEIF